MAPLCYGIMSGDLPEEAQKGRGQVGPWGGTNEWGKAGRRSVAPPDSTSYWLSCPPLFCWREEGGRGGKQVSRKSHPQRVRPILQACIVASCCVHVQDP